MTKQINFPSLPFKLRNGDDPKVRRWLKDNGCKWRDGDELMPREGWGKMLHVDCNGGVARSDLEGMEFFEEHKYPEINPYDYISATEGKTVSKFKKGQIVYVNYSYSNNWFLMHYVDHIKEGYAVNDAFTGAMRGDCTSVWDNCLTIEEYQEMVSKPNYEDWPIDAKVMVWDAGLGEKFPRHFAGVDLYGVPLAYMDGRTSHTAPGETITWDYAELVEDE